MKPIRHADENGMLLVREAFVLALFAQTNFSKMAAGLREMLDGFLAAMPSGALAWCTIGAGSSSAKPLKPAALTKCRALLDPATPPKAFTAFSLFGPEEINPAFQFDLSAKKEVEKSKAIDAETNVIEMRFDSEFVAKLGYDAFADLASRLAATIPFDSGYASPALCWATDGALRESREILVPLALKHPGFDIHVNNSTRVGLGRRVRGARWLTFLGPHPLKKLGGREKLLASLPTGVTGRPVGDGLCLRASSEPQIGDVNRKDIPAGLKAVAHLIETVTWFGDMFVRGYLFDGDNDKAERWERRFFT